VIDCFSRQAHFIPYLEATNVEELAQIFIRKVWKHHSLPKKTVSDPGTMFNSHFLRALYEQLGVQPQFSKAYHPETDGLAECTN
jgi:transposase InsO family protein